MSPHEVIGTVPENSTTFRTQADEHDDHEEALQNLRTGKYEDWPNEAAVSQILRAILSSKNFH